MKILIFGTGDYYKRYKKWFKREEIAALLDNSPSKQNTAIDGILVLPPEEGVHLLYDRIVILSFYVKSMKQQLLELGVQEEKIVHFYELYKIIDVGQYPSMLQCYGRAKEIMEDQANPQKVLLLSQDLTLGGPALALFHAAEVLVKNGYNVVYASMIDGPLREFLLAADIPVVIDRKLQIATMKQTGWTEHFSLIVCNTINYHVFLLERNCSIPVIWWLHDAEFFYDGIKREVLQNIERTHLKVVSVGPVPRNAFQKFVPNLFVEFLLYGVSNVKYQKTRNIIPEKIMRFVTIGFLEDIKGQDLLVEAISLLPNRIKSRAEFYIVGHNETLFGHQVRDMCKDISEVKFTGVLGREEIHKILTESDVLICPSRQDSMPTVAAEAMMHAVPCILSDAVGTAEYIETGVNGIVFANEDVKELSEQIAWCVKHPAKVELMGLNARKIYEQYFSMEVFERNLLNIIGDMLTD